MTSVSILALTSSSTPFLNPYSSSAAAALISSSSSF